MGRDAVFWQVLALYLVLGAAGIVTGQGPKVVPGRQICCQPREGDGWRPVKTQWLAYTCCVVLCSALISAQRSA